MKNVFKGSCLCGDIQFSVSGFSEKAANCHCSMCRKFHGAAFATLVDVNHLHWLCGEHLLKEYTAANGSIRTFCSKCGASLGFRVKGVPFKDIELAIATFDCDIPVTIDAQIYTGNKANWCELQRGIPTFEEDRQTDNEAF